MRGKKRVLMDHDPLEWVDEEPSDSETATELATELAGIGAEKMLNEAEVPVMENGMNKIRLQESEKLDRVGELQETFLQALEKNEDITVEASAVNAIDAAALQLIVLLFQKAVKQGQAVTITEPSQNFSEAAELLGLSDLFGI